MADGLATFLKEQSTEWQDKDCSFSVISPDHDDDGWGAIRLEAVVYNISGLVSLRKITKGQLAAKPGFRRGIRTTKPAPESQLYTIKAEAQWKGRLGDAVD
jgi:hypothetical protein